MKLEKEISEEIHAFASKKWKISLFGSDNSDTAIISHYLRNNDPALRNEAIEIGSSYLEKEYEAEVPPILAEHALQYLIEFKENIPFPKPENPTFTFIDLFAGIGGFRLALQNLGGECVYSSEWDKSAQKTYYTNFGEIPFGDITKDENKKWIPKKFDILCGGFPCQPFSRAGVSARNFLGQAHGFEDEKQGNLFFEIVEIIKNHRPKAVFLENVKNLRSHDRGNTIKVIEEQLRELGYSFDSKVVNAQTEVPQRRERTFIICFRDKNQKFNFPEFKGEKKILRSILEENVPDEFTISDNLWIGHQNRSIRNKNRGTGFTVSLANLDKPSNTIVARYFKDGKECLIPQDGKNPRMLTPRECARLQGFPDTFVCYPTKTSAYKQFGNSVAVPVIQRIGNEIIKLI